MRIAIGSDHAGFVLKQAVSNHLKILGHEAVDLGTFSLDVTDYVPICAAVGREVARGTCQIGVVIGGSGQGEQIAANKVKGVRAALCPDEYTAMLARNHNDANVCALGARVLAPEYALAILDTFLAQSFEGGRHAHRLAQIADIEEEEAKQGMEGG
jgi:ribose 5-phosphate isomerase B